MKLRKGILWQLLMLIVRFLLRQSEKAYRNLKVPDQIINGDKEALKQAQANWIVLDAELNLRTLP